MFTNMNNIRHFYPVSNGLFLKERSALFRGCMALLVTTVPVSKKMFIFTAKKIKLESNGTKSVA